MRNHKCLTLPGSFHHCDKAWCGGLFSPSQVLAVTPGKITGMQGANAVAKYGVYSSGGAFK